jgi:hypothetical protein
MKLREGFSCFALAAVVVLATASSALGAELTRDEYVTRAEAICKVGTTKVTPMLSDGLAEFKKNEVTGAGPKFVRAAAFYDSSRARLQAIPKPLSDADDLTAWLNRLQVQNLFLRKAGKALAEARRVQAQGFLSRFVHNGNLANDLVLGFGFKYCLFNNHFK